MKKATFDPAKGYEGVGYPPPHDQKTRGRKSWALTRQYGFTQFGVNRVELPPGAWSTLRHWHKTNDEMVVVISGELTLVTDDGEEVLGAGDCVGFRMNDPNAHHFQNRGYRPAIYFDIGGRDLYDVSTFPDEGIVSRARIDFSFAPMKPAGQR